MTTVYDVPPWALIDWTANKLKTIKVIEPPTWAPFVKTGVHKELPPESPDWWFIRGAAVLRKIYVQGALGTRKVKALYGGKKNLGVKSEHPRTGSGSVARKILQQLEEAGFLVKVKNGRQITAEGMSFLDQNANQVNMEDRKNV